MIDSEITFSLGDISAMGLETAQAAARDTLEAPDVEADEQTLRFALGTSEGVSPAVEIERVLLACSFHDNRVFANSLDEGITSAHFTSALLAAVWDALRSEVGSGSRPTISAVTSELGDSWGYLQHRHYTALVNGVEFNADEGKIARAKVLEAFNARRLQKLLADMHSASLGGNVPLDTLKTGLNQGLAELSVRESKPTDPESVSRELADYLNNEDENILGGFREWDYYTGGLYPGLHLVAGRTSMGKTAFAIGLADNVDRKGHKACFYSFEMARPKILIRLISRRKNIDSSKMSSPAKRKVYLQSTTISRRVRVGMAEFAAGNLDVVGSAMSVPQLVADIRWRADAGAKVFYIDQLNRIQRPRNYRDERIFLSEMCKTLQTLSVELGVAIVGLHQINRGVESRDDPRPNMSDLRDASIEDDADTISLLFRAEYYSRRKPKDDKDGDPKSKEYTTTDGETLFLDDDGLGWVDVVKNRDGECGNVPLAWDKSTASYYDYGEKMSLDAR